MSKLEKTKFGELTILKSDGRSSDGHLKWLCECSCGVKKHFRLSSLTLGYTKSCGCKTKIFQSQTKKTKWDAGIRRKKASGWKLAPRSKEYREKIGASHRTHGKSKTVEYSTWSRIIQRCYDTNYIDYKRYGGRGIAVSIEWRNSFETFLSDMGPRPSRGYSIDRIDNNGDYSKDNCRWATIEEQANNRRNNKIVLYHGFAYTIANLCRLLAINQKTFAAKIRKGMSVYDAIDSAK